MMGGVAEVLLFEKKKERFCKQSASWRSKKSTKNTLQSPGQTRPLKR